MTRTNKRSKDQRAAFTPGRTGIAQASLFGHVDSLFRRVGRAWPLTLAEYIRAEEFFTRHLEREQNPLRTTI